MASIKVTLELDDKEYVSKLKAAETQTKALGAAGASAGTAGAAGIGAMTVAMRGLQAASMAAMSAMAPLLAAVATFQTISAAFTLGDDISDLAAGSGIAAASIINLRAALAASGGSADDAALMIAKLTNNLEAATEMGSQAQKNLLKLGFSLEDIQTMTPEEALRQTIVGLSQMEDPIQRNAMAFDMLGKRAAQIDWNNVEQSTRTITAEQKAQGEAAERVGEAFDVVGAAFNSTMLALMDLLSPFADLITALSNSSELSGVTSVIFTTLKGVFASTATIAYGLAQTIIGLVDGIYSLGKAGVQVLSRDISGASNTFNSMLGRQEERLKKTGDFAVGQWNRIVNPPAPTGRDNNTPRRALRPGAGDAAKANREAEAYERQITQAIELGNAIEAQTTSLSKKYDVELKNIGLTQDQIRLNNELAALNEKQLADIAKIESLNKLSDAEKAARIEEINKKYADQEQTIRNGNRAVNDAVLAEQRRLRLLQEISEAQARLVKRQYEGYIVQQELQQAVGNQGSRETKRNIERLRIEGNFLAQRTQLEKDYANAIEQSQKDDIERRLRTLQDGYNEEITALKNKILVEDTLRQSQRAGMVSVLENLADSVTPFQVAVDATSAVFGNLENAISDFAKTGKFNFGEFAKSVIRDLIAITLRAIILRTILAAFGNIFGGGGGGGTAMTLNTQVPDTGIRFAAAGGPIRANQGYIVGEKGPEFFMPNTSGTMVPNHALGGSTVVNYNINAVDATSFRDLVARDPEFIYSVTQVGARRIPR